MFNKIICASIICVLSAASLAKNDLPYKEGRILVRFAPKSDKSKRTNIENNQILASVNVGTVKESLDFVPGLAVVKLPPNLSVEQALARLKNNPEILYAEPDYKLEFRSTYPNDYYFDALWAFENNHGTEDADIDAPEAWDIVTDSHIIVAVIDSGIDYTHPDLAENIWLNQAELNGLPGVDDDNNGYIDDIRGWNFDPDVNDNDPMDLYGHGTMIAGIIGAVGNNGLGVTGVCWRVKLMAVNISEYDDMDWHLLASSAVKGINYAVNNGAKVINASWGGSTPIQALEDAIEAADNNSVLIIAAVPNKYWLDMDVSPDYPSWYNFDNIISVLATNTNDNKSNYSAYGQTKVDLGAPGGEYNGNPWGDSMIWSTVPGGGYDFSQGTSYATPYVSGACALVWAANPKLTHYQVREAILSSVDVKLSLSDKCASGGRLNLYKAVTYFPIPVRLTITADVNDCIAPLTTINYNIHYDPNGFDDTNVYIIDELPVGVEYLSSNPAGNYDPFNGTVTWEIPSFGPNNPGDITLTVAVTEAANPGSTLINICKIIGDSFRKSASVNTCVDCWSGSIIYVDPNAPVGGNGRSWSSAYKNIQTAIDAAERDVNCPSREIWIKTGEYKPVNDTGVPYWYNYSFELFDDLSLIGHFEGCENRPAERKLNNPAFETILQGQISAGNKVYNIVKADNVNNAVLDGFIINNAAQEGLKIAANSNIAVANCTLKQNIYGMKLEQNTCADIYNCKFINNYCYGIEAHASAANLSGCLFKNNTDSGIYAESCDSLAVSKTSFDGNGGNCDCGLQALYIDSLDITDCTFEGFLYQSVYTYGVNLTMTDSRFKSNYRGLWCENSDVFIARNIISNNQGTGIDLRNPNSASITNNLIYKNNSYGIYIDYPPETTHIRNNTIVNNSSWGIYCSGGVAPTITNCIVWGNYWGNNIFGCTAAYSCIQGANGTNISADPCFVNPCTGNFHLLPNSPCRNAGTGNFPDEKDIDGEDRTRDGVTDMGADEYCWPDIDLNGDEIVNLIDFSLMASGWQDTFNNIHLNMLSHDWLWGSKWGHKYDLNNDYIINFKDFATFANVWLFTSNFGCCDFYPDNHINNADLEILAQNWLWSTPLKLAQTVYIPPAQPIPNSIEEPLTCEQIDELAMWIDDMWDSNEFGGTYEEYIEFRDSLWIGVDCNEIEWDPNLWFGEGLYQTTTSESSFNSMDSMMPEQLIEDLVRWLDEIWESGYLKDAMTYEQYLDFRKDIFLPFKE